MAVVSVSEVGHGRRRGNWPAEFDRATQIQLRDHDRVFRVVTSDVLDDDWVVINASDLPQTWDEHPNDEDAVVTSYQITETEDPNRWYVTVRYQYIVNPLDEPAVVTVSTVTEEFALEQDVLGAPIRNTAGPVGADGNRAGDPFDPPPTLPERIQVISVRKNFASLDLDVIVASYLDHTNDPAFTIPEVGTFAAGLVMLADFRATKEWRLDISYWACDFVFHARKRGWHLRPLNLGYREWVAASGDRRIIRGIDGNPVPQPALLAADGTKLAPGGTPVFLDFTVRDVIDFAALGLF